MTLTGLLGINRRLLKYEDEPGLKFAERLWLDSGSPCNGQQLCDVLETILRRSAEEGICYPAILLKRKKQIERGTWSPEKGRDSGESNSSPKEGDPACPKCSGSGHVPIENGLHVRFCECNKWMRSQVAVKVQ